MTEAEAFRHIQRRSMDERRSMRAVAQDVLDATSGDATHTGKKPPATVLPD
jgi:AmiR/NasT family two-component response regulator